MFDLESLNDVQRQATEDTEGAVLVFAGAGSGKTRVLTHRVAYLVKEKKVSPHNILAITFTNKATSEMKERLLSMVDSSSVWVSTFHALCTKILFRNAEKIGYTRGFSIFDTTATKRMIKRALREKHLDEEKEDKYLYHISSAKNANLNSSQYFSQIRHIKDAMQICEVFDRYQEILKDNNAMDFDDLLIKCLELFRSHKDVLEYYQNRFRYVHVDEFQDTNAVQFEIVKMLSAKWGNLFVVGDDDQSIYGWRGANVSNIIDFDKYFANVKTYKLVQNYRSTNCILDCANNLIKNNSSRVDKVLTTQQKGGVRVEYQYHMDEYKEVDGVVNTILQLKRLYHYTNSDFAILVRQNSLTRLYEMNFSRANLSYKVFGGFRFFDRKEIQDIIAYLRVLANPKDSEAILRIINFPTRGIGNTTIENLTSYANEKELSLFEVVSEIRTNNDFSPGIKNKVSAFTNLINSFAADLHTQKFSNFVEEMVNRLNLEQFYLSTGKEDDQNRWENVKEFLTHVKENFDDDETTLEEFLHNFSLNSVAEEKVDNDFVTIATMHAAKGLEFKVVFIVACEEQIVPSSRCFTEPNGIEEERRVMYVAITRARERLYISCVNGVRTKFGRKEHTAPSRFISEAKGAEKLPLPEKFSKYARTGEYDDDYSDAIPKSHVIKKLDFVPNVKIDNKPTVKSSDTSRFVSGAKVKHKKYGLGTILVTEGTGIGKTVTVVFKDLGIKKFSAASAPITLI
jgi:DNA helicase-2/ATP-dependent DNA helicase PcrA